MKLTNYYYDELSELQQARVQNDFCRNGYNPDYLNDTYSRSIVNAQVVVDKDFNLYDIKVFDPYHVVKGGNYLQVYIGPNGWSHWLIEYRDNAGNDMDTIFEDYDGETQDI